MPPKQRAQIIYSKSRHIIGSTNSSATNTCVIHSGPRDQDANKALQAIPNKLQKIMQLCQQISEKKYETKPRQFDTLQSVKYDLQILCQHLLDLKLHWQDHYYYHLIEKQKAGQNNITPYDPVRVIQRTAEHDVCAQFTDDRFDFYLNILNKLASIQDFNAATPQAIREKVWRANPDGNTNQAISFAALQQNNSFYKESEASYIAAQSEGWKQHYKKTASETAGILQSHFDIITQYKNKPADEKLIMSIAAVGEIFATINNDTLKVNDRDISKAEYKHFIAVRNGVYAFDKPVKNEDLKAAITYVASFYSQQTNLDSKNSSALTLKQ